MVNDRYGIKLLYPSSTTNEQSLFFPDRSSELQSSGNLQSKVTNLNGTMSTFVSGDIIGWYEFEPESGDDVKMLFLPSSLTSEDNEITIDVNCDLSHEEARNQTYVNDSGEWQNIEMTSHIFVKTVNKASGYIIMEARNGYDGDKGGCCQGTAYGVRLFWDTASGKKGTFEFYKKVFTGSVEESPLHAQELPAIVPSFYQQWFGVKFCVYNAFENVAPEAGGFRARLELWLTPVVFANPGHASSNQWKRVGMEEDYIGFGWNDSGGECDAIEDDAPITWGTPFVGFGWKDGSVIQFNYTSCREIDVGGSFGEDPEPEPNPNPDPGLPDPDPEPPTTPPPAPPDAEPPLTPTTLTKRLTIRREILNNKLCSCDGFTETVPVPPGGGTGGGGTGGGGGGGTGTLLTLYNVALDTSSFARLAKVTGSTTHYLRFGQGVTQTNSVWIGKSINRVEITLADTGNPTGGTGGGVHCRIRKGSDDTIAATLSPVATETEILNAGKVFIFENLANTYKLVFGDMLLFEYDGGDTNNYVHVFMTEQPTTTGTKIVWQANNQDAGEYSNAPALDICARVYTLTP